MTQARRAGPTPAVDRWIRRFSLVKATFQFVAPTTLTHVVLLLAAIAAAYASFFSPPGTIGYLGAGLAIVMLSIAIIDGRSYVIPDWLNVAGGALGIMHAAAQEPDAVLPSVAEAALRGAVLALIFFAIRAGYARLRGRQGLGLGDVKLAFVAGVWLDWFIIPIAIELAAFAALSVYLLRQISCGRTLSPRSRIPFGLFFAPAIWICWVLEVRWAGAF